MAGRKFGSSELIEFSIAFVVGLLAVLGGLFVIGFLLVEPVRNPPGSQGNIGIEELVGECPVSFRRTSLPSGCTHNGNQDVETAFCNQLACDSCSESDPDSVCCCRAITAAPVDGIECVEGLLAPSIANATLCGCTVCDDIQVRIRMTVSHRETLEAVRAAQVYRVDDSGGLRLLGITDNLGRFVFLEPVVSRSITLQILAAGFIQYHSMPVPLEPSQTTVILNVKLIPLMSIPAGLGGSAITLRLGSTAIISAPAGAFHTPEGALYEDVVTFEGTVMMSSDENEFTGLPATDFIAYDRETDSFIPFGAVLVTFLRFIGSEGEELSSEDLRLAVSILSNNGTIPDLFLAVYNETTGQWTKESTFAPLPQFKKKRQTQQPPVVFEGNDIPSAVFVAVAAGNQANCWLQGRVFDEAGTALTTFDSRFITMAQRVNMGGSLFLFQFGSNTGSPINTGTGTYAPNALCLPLVCTDILDASVHSRVILDPASMRLLPIDFPQATFTVLEPAPIVLRTNFIFDELVLADVGQPKPFYDSFAACQTNAIEDDATSDPSDYFRFEDRAIIEEPVPLDDTCFIKIQILDCFEGNLVTIQSIDPNSGIITETTTVFVTEPEDEITTDIFTTDATTMGSGTTPEPLETTTTEEMPTTPFVCDSSTATRRTVCLPFVCGNTIQLLVRPAPSLNLPGLCNVISRAILLTEGGPGVQVSDDPVDDTPFVIRTTRLIAQDFNNPLLGLYHEEGNSAMAAMFAEEMCNFGGMSTSSTLNDTTGIAVTFSCDDNIQP